MKTLILTAAVGVLSLSFCGTAGAQAPLPGQPYQVPAGYEAYGPGTLVTYGSFNYVIQGDGTMVLSAPPPCATLPPPAPCDDPTAGYYQPSPTYGDPQWTTMPNWYPTQPAGNAWGWGTVPNQSGWGTSPNQMGNYQYQPVNYQGHSGYLVQGSNYGHHYTGLFTQPPHRSHW